MERLYAGLLNAETRGSVASASSALPGVISGGRPPLTNIGYWGDGAVTAREAQLTFVRQLADRLPYLEDQRVLDAGCGVGGSASVLALEYGAVVDAVGGPFEQIKLARRYATAQGLENRVRFHLADVSKLPFDDSAFDAVFSLEAAHRFIDKPRFVEEAHRVLRPGGLIVLADMTSEPNLLVARGRSGLRRTLASADDWRRMIEHAGFELLEFRLLGCSVYPGYRRWLLLTAGERRRAILARLAADDVSRRLPLRNARAWFTEFTENRSVPTLSVTLRLWEYVLVTARRPAG